MAKRKVQTVKKAKPKKRMTRANKLSLEEMHYGPEPEVGYFDDHNLSAYLNWFNYFYDRKQAVTAYITYAKEQGFKNANKLKNLNWPSSNAFISIGLRKGIEFPLPESAINQEQTGNQHYHLKFMSHIKETLKKADDIDFQKDNKADEVKLSKRRKSVQENIKSKVYQVCGEIDHAVDMWQTQDFDTYKYLADLKVSATVAKGIPEEYQSIIDELNELLGPNCHPQLKEGYSYLSRQEQKDYYNFVRGIQTDAMRYAEMNKPIRKKRKVSADRQVKKLSYLKEDRDNKIKSIDPLLIIGAQRLWIYNSKTNEIVKYEAIDRGGLGCKGTTLQNFDEKASGCKKVGVRTEHFIDRILDGGKVVLNKVMDEITSKKQSVTGRINNNMVLLKVE